MDRKKSQTIHFSKKFIILILYFVNVKYKIIYFLYNWKKMLWKIPQKFSKFSHFTIFIVKNDNECKEY